MLPTIVKLDISAGEFILFIKLHHYLKILFSISSVNELTKCFERAVLHSSCKDRIDQFNAFLEIVLGNINSDALCGDYGDDSDKCAKLPAPPKRKENEKVPETLLFPFYDIVNSIPESR